MTVFGTATVRTGQWDLVTGVFYGDNVPVVHSSFTLYINGVWKGYFNLCEHLREAFMQQHHNSSATWDVQQVSAFTSGDAIHWNTTIAFLGILRSMP